MEFYVGEEVIVITSAVQRLGRHVETITLTGFVVSLDDDFLHLSESVNGPVVKSIRREKIAVIYLSEVLREDDVWDGQTH